MSLIERRPRSTPSGIICCLSAARARFSFLHSVLLVAIDSRLSNAPAAASSYIIRGLRRIEIISIRAPQVVSALFGIRRRRGPARRRHHYSHICQI